MKILNVTARYTTYDNVDGELKETVWERSNAACLVGSESGLCSFVDHNPPLKNAELALTDIPVSELFADLPEMHRIWMLWWDAEKGEWIFDIERSLPPDAPRVVLIERTNLEDWESR